jgi:uncharacterized protein YjbI with pentapeptide repeats
MNADLRFTNMTNADADSTRVNQANLLSANLSGANFTYATGCSTVTPKRTLNGKGCNN